MRRPWLQVLSSRASAILVETDQNMGEPRVCITPPRWLRALLRNAVHQHEQELRFARSQTVVGRLLFVRMECALSWRVSERTQAKYLAFELHRPLRHTALLLVSRCYNYSQTEIIRITVLMKINIEEGRGDGSMFILLRGRESWRGVRPSPRSLQVERTKHPMDRRLN